MKCFSISLAYFFSIILIQSIIHSEGFTHGTLVHTPKKLIPIEQLTSGKRVKSVNHLFQQKTSFITNTYYDIINFYIRIDIEDTHIYAAPNQRFYSKTKQKWITANSLTTEDSLLCYNNKSVPINGIKLILKSTKIYTLSIHESHTYCVSDYAIITHNFEPITLAATTTFGIVFPPAIPTLIGIQTIIGGVISGIGCYLAYKNHKQKKIISTEIAKQKTNSNCSNGNPKKPDDDNDDEHPHGIYENAPYHHPNSSYDKSPSPQNGQKCLDYSLPYLGKE